MTRLTGIVAMVWLMLGSFAAAAEKLVVVELYTSQGCSSCPPADNFFKEALAERDDVIALALHVDYWDYLGWKDNFASAQYTKRQKNYARAAGHRSVYTPQMIISGQDHVIGSHPKEVLNHVKRHASKAPEVKVELKRKGGSAIISLENLNPSKQEAVDVFLVRYLPQETVSIKRGENAGRELVYANIVSDWRQVDMWDMSQAVELKVPVQGKNPVVVIVQREKNGPILAAARLK